MPVYIRKNVSFTPPSIYNMQLEDDNDYLLDPDQMRDILPQPYRMINKILTQIVEDSWVILEEKEKALPRDSDDKPPQLTESDPVAICGTATALSESVDGKVVFAGLPNGLSAFDASTQFPLHTWEEEHAEITSIKTYLLAPGYHMLLTIDDMAIARIFLFALDHLFLVKTMNENSPDGAAKILCNKFEASFDADFVGISFENTSTKEVWLEVHKVPLESWVKELDSMQATIQATVDKQQKESLTEATESEEHQVSTTEDLSSEEKTRSSVEVSEKEEDQQQEQQQQQQQQAKQSQQQQHGSEVFANSVESIMEKVGVKFNSPTPTFKAKPPAHLTPPANQSSSVASAVSKVDQGDVLGVGLNHILSSHFLESRDVMFSHRHQSLLEYLPEEEEEKTMSVNFHFANPSRMITSGLDSSMSQDKPVSVVVWWEGTQHVCLYSLCKNSKDMEFKPDVVWPCADLLTCSAVSRCASHLVFGLANGNLLLWDFQMGVPKAVLPVNGTKGVRNVRFLDSSLFPLETPHYPPYPVTAATFILAEYKDGTQALFDTCDGSQQIPRIIRTVPETDEEMETLIKVIPDTPDLMLYMKKSGSMYIKDIGTGGTLCEICLPPTHSIQSPWNPILSLGDGGKILYVKGEGSDVSVEGEVSDISCVFKFNLRDYSVLGEYWTRTRDKSNLVVFTTCEQRLEALMKERLEQQAMRKPRMQKHWGQLRGELDLIQNAKTIAVDSDRLTF